MTLSSTQIVEKLLQNTTNKEAMEELVASDATYVSLNYDNPDLHQLMPWAGTHSKRGAQGIFETFKGVGKYWTTENFDVQALFGSGENVAAFGTFTLKSRVLGKAATSPFSIWCVVKEGKITYMQFMEDTFATSSTFRSGGHWTFRANPDGGEQSI
ncbi:MAG: hypothetical protein M1827_000422 [Pycnora praestabilis]|nr:MAG: hypothetical protein M1827_000422 [Pycnora praestabilis]